ncbi:hypothetical protein [Mycoplasma sp. CB776]
MINLKNKIRISFYLKTYSNILFFIWISVIIIVWTTLSLDYKYFPLFWFGWGTLWVAGILYLYILFVYMKLIKIRIKVEENPDIEIKFKSFFIFFIKEKTIMKFISDSKYQAKLNFALKMYNKRLLLSTFLPIPYYLILKLKIKKEEKNQRTLIMEKINRISEDLANLKINTIIKGSFAFNFFKNFKFLGKYNDVDLFLKYGDLIDKKEILNIFEKHGKVVFHNSFLISLIINLKDKETRFEFFLTEDIDLSLCNKQNEHLYIAPVEYLFLAKIFHLPKLEKTEIFPYDEKMQKTIFIIKQILNNKQKWNMNIINSLIEQIYLNNLKLIFHIEYDEKDLSISSFIQKKKEWVEKKFTSKDLLNLNQFTEKFFLKNKMSDFFDFLFLKRKIIIESLYETPIIEVINTYEWNFNNSQLLFNSSISFDEFYESNTKIINNIIYTNSKEQIYWLMLNILINENEENLKTKLEIDLNKEFSEILNKNKDMYEININDLILKIKEIYFKSSTM